MGEITRPWIGATLRKANPSAKPAAVQAYADLFAAYAEAGLNIARHGAIVAHPKTGSPIDNPYLKVRSGALAEMTKLRASRLNVDALWEAYEKEVEASGNGGAA